MRIGGTIADREKYSHRKIDRRRVLSVRKEMPVVIRRKVQTAQIHGAKDGHPKV